VAYLKALLRPSPGASEENAQKPVTLLGIPVETVTGATRTQVCSQPCFTLLGYIQSYVRRQNGESVLHNAENIPKREDGEQ